MGLRALMCEEGCLGCGRVGSMLAASAVVWWAGGASVGADAGLFAFADRRPSVLPKEQSHTRVCSLFCVVQVSWWAAQPCL